MGVADDWFAKHQKKEIVGHGTKWIYVIYLNPKGFT